MRYLDGVTGGEAAAVKAWLLPLLADATVAGLRTGFLTEAGAEMIAPALEAMLRRGGRLHVVTGGHPDQTEPAALAILAGLAAGFPGHAMVCLAGPDPGWQNARTYYVRAADGTCMAYVGSADLTRGGLAADHEAGVILDSADDGEDAINAVLHGITAWAEHPGARRVTAGTLAEFAGQSRTSRAGRVRLPAAASPSRSLAEMLPEALGSIQARGTGGITGVPTGFAELDGLTSGLHPGTLTVIGGGSSAGKSALVLDFCRSASIQHKLPVVLFSLEMTAAEINTRLLSAESRVPAHLMRTGQMDDDNRARLTERMAEIADVPFYISESPALSIDALSDEAARLVAGQGIRLIAVDCLQLITTDRRFENREREVAEIAQQLKALALGLQVPVVVAAQLNRDLEQRADKRPLLADLRDSDAIAQAADLVVLLHREDVYERESPRAGEADFIVAKHRNGPTATVTVAFQGHYSRFADISASD